MARNQKLTGVIGGRTVSAVRQQGTVMNIDFTDGSTMEIQLQDGAQGLTGKGTVAAIRQQGTAMNIDFQDGSTMEIPLQEETSSVMVRDKDRKMEYAD